MCFNLAFVVVVRGGFVGLLSVLGFPCSWAVFVSLSVVVCCYVVWLLVVCLAWCRFL